MPQLRAADSDLKAIQDNSFLAEEAYNQEKDVVQHINLFMRDLRTHEWTYTFTQEWPAGGEKNQLSYTLPFSGTSGQRFGPVMLNYRYQLVGNGDAITAIAPRVTLILPSHGASSGVQFEVPVSHVLGERLISHSDAGFTKFRDRGSLDPNLAQSFVYALNGRVHLMLESVWTRTDHVSDFVVSPGVRWAYNFKSGLQIVPGIGVPIGVGPSAGQRSILVYLSFEHPYR